jgi:hypothetical protein
VDGVFSITKCNKVAQVMANARKTRRNTASTIMSTHPLTADEMRIVAEFVEQAADTYFDHSANEFQLPDTPVRRKIVVAANELYARDSGEAPTSSSRPVVQEGVIYADDYVLMHFFGLRWAALAQRLERGKPMQPPLGQEELETVASVLEELACNDYQEFSSKDGEEDYSLPPTPKGQALAEAVIRHAGRRDTNKRIKSALAGEYGCDVFCTWLLAYLAARCRAMGGMSPAKGLGFDDKDVGLKLLPAASSLSSRPQAPAASAMLPHIKRPGIGPGWLREWKRFVRTQGEDAQPGGLHEYFIDNLVKYATEGNTDNEEPGISPPYRSWEFALATDLHNYANMWISKIESQAVDDTGFDASTWLPVFTGSYFQALIEFYSMICSPLRFPGEPITPTLDYRRLLYTALGFIIGCKDEALRQARIQVIGHGLEMFDKPHFFPASQCVLRIFADYLGEPEPQLQGEALTHPIYNALAKHWRHPDAEALAPLLLATADEHTRRNIACKPYGNNFDFDYFARTPVEILLVFKLRQELGLRNPKLDHPLMNTALGVLPNEVPFRLDGVIGPVVARMRDDGFDEEKILADFVKGVSGQN